MKVKAKTVNATPYGLARISEAFYSTANNFDKKDYFLVHLFLYCASIEIGLKACILSKNNSDCKKLFVQHKIGHDINKAIKEFDKLFKGKINKYYKNKGLEYFTSDVIFSLANGGKDFPTPAELKIIGDIVNDFLKKNSYFI